MPHISETADLEAQIEALIKQAGESLRQTLNNDKLHRDRADEGGGDQASQKPSADPVSGNAGGHTGPNMESEG